MSHNRIDEASDEKRICQISIHMNTLKCQKLDGRPGKRPASPGMSSSPRQWHHLQWLKQLQQRPFERTSLLQNYQHRPFELQRNLLLDQTGSGFFF